MRREKCIRFEIHDIRNPSIVINLRRFFYIIVFSMLLMLHCTSSNPGKKNEKYNLQTKVKRLGPLPDVLKAPALMVDDSQIYVWDKFLCKVYIYSKKDLTNIAEFGRKGEAPAEFLTIHGAGLTDKYIYVNSYPRLSFFSKDGKFLKEMKGSSDAGLFIPIGHNFIGRKHIYSPPPKNDKYAYILFDKDLRKIKELIETEYMREFQDVKPKMKVSWFKDCYKGVVYKDRFYVGSTGRGFYFAVFNADGERLYEIEKDYERIKVTQNIKDYILENVRKVEDQGLKKYFSQIDIYFPDYFPAYITFAVDHDQIYVFKYPRHKAATLEVMVLDLGGNLIKTTNLPSSFWKGLQENSLYLYDGNLYFIDLGEDMETPEIYEATID